MSRALGQPLSRLGVGPLLAVIYISFGSSFLAIQVMVRDLPPLTAAATRFLAAGLILSIGVGLRRGWRTLLPSTRQIPFLLLLGALLFLVGNGGVVLAQYHGVSSWLASLIIATVPVWVAILRLIWGPRPGALTMIGTVVGLLGATLVLLPPAANGGSRLLLALPALAGAIGWSVGTFLASRRGAAEHPVVASAQQLTSGGVLLFLAALISEHGRWSTITFTWSSVAAWAWLAITASVISMVAFYRIVALSSVSTASTYAFVNPVVAVLLAGLLLGDWPDPLAAAATPLVVIGVALVVLGDRRQRPQPDESPPASITPTGGRDAAP
jgi:drug/metabolite transporter (DMT)-like permease